MSRVDEFEQNSGAFANHQDDPLSNKGFSAFLKEHGPEQAKGFCLAISTLRPVVEKIARGDVVGKTRHPNGNLYNAYNSVTPGQRVKRSRELLKHMEEFLELASLLGIISDQEKNPGANSEGPAI